MYFLHSYGNRSRYINNHQLFFFLFSSDSHQAACTHGNNRPCSQMNVRSRVQFYCGSPHILLVTSTTVVKSCLLSQFSPLCSRRCNRCPQGTPLCLPHTRDWVLSSSIAIIAVFSMRCKYPCLSHRLLAIFHLDLSLSVSRLWLVPDIPLYYP